MFGPPSKEFCENCGAKAAVLRQMEDGKWLCESGCNPDLIKGMLVESGNARESEPVYNHLESCIPPVDHFPEYGNESEPPPAPVDLNEVRAEKEFPGMKELMEMMRKQMAPTLMKNNIEKLAMDLFVKIYNGSQSTELVDIDTSWYLAMKFFERKPPQLI